MQSSGFSKGAYFVGKLAWAKGLDLLFQHMEFVKKRCFYIYIMFYNMRTGDV